MSSHFKSQIADLITQFVGQSNVITVQVALIDATGSIEAALFLSQLLYWSDRGSLQDGWIAKTYKDWHEEIRLSKYQISKATNSLAEAGIETKLAKWAGAPTVHYRINREKFSQWIVKKLDNRLSKNFTNECEETSQSYTETTTETTTEGKSAPLSENQEVVIPATGEGKETPSAKQKPVKTTRTPEQISQDEIAQAWFDAVGGFGTAPTYYRKEAALLIEQGATPELVKLMAAERNAGREDTYKLAWLVEDWSEWNAQRERRAREQKEIERQRRIADQERAWRREMLGGAV